MARTKQSKQSVLQTLEDCIDKSTSVVFASLKGLKVSESEVLRKSARAELLDVAMAKKTLLSRAFKEKGYEEIDVKALDGEIIATFSYGDEIAPARVLANFAKTHEQFKILGGLIASSPKGERALSAAAVMQLSKLPSREELMAKLLALLNTPASNLVRLLNTPATKLTQVLAAKAAQTSNL
ncbi:50S ribosomal protein L10 [Candidatus Uhrbacteria bacterium]|nr:50S ribosomal protein L10 [Candidatus Uhrbacteria bacterium]